MPAAERIPAPASSLGSMVCHSLTHGVYYLSRTDQTRLCIVIAMRIRRIFNHA